MRGQLTLDSIFSDLRNDFRAGKDTRFNSRLAGVASAGSGADYHYRDERQFLHMLERARFYQRNDPIVGQGVRRLIANILQDGFTLDVTTGDEGLNTELRERWREWSADPDMCHSEGELSWHQMEQLALSTVIVDGDVFALPLRSGALQFVEAHRVRTPRNTTRNVVHGVLVDNMARRREYWITKEDLDPNRALNRVADIRAYPARDREGNRLVNHLYMPYRFSQRRGVTACAPISDTIGMHDDVQFATLVKQQMQALIAILHEREVDWQPAGDQQKGDRSTEVDGSYTRTIEGVSAGLEIFGDPGEKLSAFSPNVPNDNFFLHSRMIQTFIAINLDLPLQLLLLDPTETNFSSWRGAVDQARLRFKQIQQWLADIFHSRTYRWKVRQWSARDAALARNANVMSHKWNCPAFPYIEPMKDAQADVLQRDKGLNSPRRLHAARGRDYDAVVREIVEDHTMLIAAATEAAEELNSVYSEAEVTWRDVLNPYASEAPPEEQDEPTVPLSGGQRPENRLHGNNGHTRN